jgi:S-formylglutathione hydrolase FrmB
MSRSDNWRENSLTNRLAKKAQRKHRHPSGIRHKPSPDGTHKWETNASLARYRKRRNARNRLAAASRARNRHV